MNLGIKRAWERLQYDINKRHFLSYNYQLQLIRMDLSNWLTIKKAEFDSGNYNPSSCFICEVPKGKELVRPGTHLTIDDSLIYIALITDCCQNIFDKLKWSQNVIDFSYVLSDNHKREDWFVNQFESWSNFRIESLKKIEKGASYVVFTDITGFYENIDIPRLISDLRNCDIDHQIINQISKCLNKWSSINNKGIPQGQSPSDILAKLYLNAVDLGLKNSEFDHLRYVDDIRIFCKTKSVAKRALIELTQLLRKRGLNLQSAKTEILNAVESKAKIESIFPIINSVASKLKEETIIVVDSYYGGSYEYYDPNAEISEDSERVLEETFRSYFIEAEDSKFNKSLFHYLLNRLKEAENSFALDYCLSMLEIHPEETSSILEYSKSINDFDIILDDSKNRMVNKLVDFLNSEAAIYDYQNYKIVNWFLENCVNPDEKLMKTMRSLAYDFNRPFYIQTSVRTFLGKFGDDADLEKLENQYSFYANEIEKAEIVCCLGRLEKARRNSFLGRIKHDGYLIKLASERIKSVN